MVANKIREFRKEKGFTQAQLAGAVGTSQQQIQRIETGKQSVRFELAVKICEALGREMVKVFPESKRPIAKVLSAIDPFERLMMDEGLGEDMGKAGIEMDPRVFRFKYRLRGGAEGELPLSAKENSFLWKKIQSDDMSTPFVVFSAYNKMVALNRRHLLYCHFLWDSPCYEANEEEFYGLNVYLNDSKHGLSFRVDADEDNPEDEEDDGQIGDMLFMLETNVEENYMISFIDEDGERAFFRAMDVAMVEVPLWIIDPDILTEEELAEEESMGVEC
ncbi:MAG: hypothetical protein C0617_01650 [Desulfuromonas sp.]|uniref:helix-turn-helix transcriptional regulator n=1 Tax=Desulfuromonas sp. TaxID=892 RepID=UPI000CBDF3C1|nr:XRE family transcriptional regulator [Desulfuromonas sp.]PLX86309.1 MAG: hypothetical protein C0617_01650 [Desulfuromonas sp.]